MNGSPSSHLATPFICGLQYLHFKMTTHYYFGVVFINTSKTIYQIHYLPKYGILSPYNKPKPFITLVKTKNMTDCLALEIVVDEMFYLIGK